MNHCGMQHSAFAALEEMRGVFAAAAAGDREQPVICPKPRRLGQLIGGDTARPFRFQPRNQTDLSDSRAGADLLDIFLAKGGEVVSSPPFFSGSPPTRASNPVVQDSRFEEKPPIVTRTASSPISPRKGCARAKFGLKPAAVRIEGFDCHLDQDHCNITAVA